MASSRVDKLAKTVAQLDLQLESHQTPSKKIQSSEKIKGLCTEIKDVIVSHDFNAVYKEDNRYADQVNKSIQTVFKLVNYPDQNMRAFAEEMLDSILRSLLLGFHQYRVLVCLISEISRNGPARSLVAAYTRLASLIHLSKTNRVISYGVHIASALGAMLKRPEETVQQAIIQHTPTIFNAIGARMREQQTEKLFSLYQVAAENLDLTGTTNRAAVVVISQICLYNWSILNKAFVRCYSNTQSPNDGECKSLLVGSLNTLKNIWPIIRKRQKHFQDDMLKMCLASTCCCLYSKQSEVIVASIEFFQVVFDNPLKLLNAFDPTDFSAMMAWKPLLSADRFSLSSPRLDGDDASSIKSFSTLDISGNEDSEQQFNAPLVFPDSPRYHDDGSDSDVTETGADEEIIDPLLHADLYEEANRTATPPNDDAGDPFSTPVKSSAIPAHPPLNVCPEATDFFVYTAATLAKLFLLAGLKGLKNDREVRISHKMLALNCLVSISSHRDLTNTVVLFEDGQQALHEASRFVLHEDDQLCASAVQFMVSLDRWRPLHKESYQKVSTSFQVIRKRALLQAFVGRHDLMLELELTEQLLDLAQSQAKSSYFLIQITCADFLSNIKWSKLSTDLKRRFQKSCLGSYFDLLFANDPKVSKAAVDNFARLVKNADMTKFTSAFQTGLPSEPLTNTGLIPAVLNLSREFNFFNESPDYVIESNLEIILQELNSAYIEDSESRSLAYCSAFEALMEAFPPTIYYEVWGGINRSGMPTPTILTTILDKCEASLSSASALTTGLNVIGKIFAGMCEGHIVQVVREQASVDRNALPKLPEPPVLDRILLLSLRTINMYYSLIAEHRSTLSQASSSLLNRPTMSPLLNKKPSPNRIADISHLMGTNVHPSRKSSYLDSLTLSTIFPSIQGAYTNFLESLNKDHEQKFCSLLQAAINCLSCVCEMLSFGQMKPLVEEILLYIKVVLEVVPSHASSLLHQMFKVVFGKNAANINLNCLNSLKMKDPLPPRSKEEMYYLRYANEFTTFSSLISRKDYISSYIHRELGWLKSDMLSKIHVPSSSEIATALEPFEGFVTQLRHIYNAYQSVEFKKTVLRVMCELSRNGIIYNMADPKKILLDLVIQQTEDPTFGNMEVLTEIALFLVVLARTSVLKFEHILKIGSNLLEKVNEYNAKHILEAVRVIILELLYVQQVELDLLYTSFTTRSKDFFQYAPDETLYIWMLILHMTDKNSLKSMSIDFFGNFSDYMSNDVTDFNCSFTLVCATLSMMSPSMFLPVDNIFKLLQVFIAEDCSQKKYWGRVTVTLFILLHAVEEDPLLLRLEDIIPEPLNWLSRSIVGLISKGLDSIKCQDFPATMFVHYLQTLTTVFKSDHYKLLNGMVCKRINDALFEKQSIFFNWTVYSQLLQLYKLSPDFNEVLESLKPTASQSHIKDLHEVFTTLDKEDANKNGVSSVDFGQNNPNSRLNAVCLADCAQEEILLSLFDDSSREMHSSHFTAVLLAPPATIYLVLNRMNNQRRALFLTNLCSQMAIQLNTTTAKEALKTRVAKYQEFLDAIEDNIQITSSSRNEDVVTHLVVVGSIKALVFSEPNLQCVMVSEEKLARVLQFAADGKLERYTVEGFGFLLEAESAKLILSDNPLWNLNLFDQVLQHISSKFIRKEVKKLSTEETFIVNCSSEKISPTSVPKSIEEQLGDIFDVTQHIIQYLKSGSHTIPTEFILLLRTLFRLPVLHSFAIVPLAAFNMQWTLRVNVKSQPVSVNVPLVNIHMLCNIDVLHDFSWRISLVGWTSRQQFEDFWMSLFGVLSSTPTGAEMADNQNVTEQILASSSAVSTLTDILLYTLLFPEPGNVPTGNFVVKDREKNELFYESKAMSQLLAILGKTRDRNSDILFTRNLERLDENGQLYDLGQLCAMSLWTLTGDLRSAKKDSPERIKVSLSEYLLKTTSELDTASSVRALFENFSHWFSRGLEFLPLPLLSATVRSMVFLSDLFDEGQSYEFLYNQIKNVYRGGFLAHHSDLGYVIYCLLKTVTVIGVDSVERTMTEADVAKMLLTWIENGLTSKYPFVKTATLHGILYILQSMAVECLKPVYQYVASFLNAELSDITAKTDVLTVSENSIGFNYQKVMWSVAFRLMEEPMQVNFRNNLNRLISNYYLSPNCSNKTLEIVTSGVEQLILHSASYLPHYLETVAQNFKDYSTMGYVFPYSLRIFTVCVFREEVNQRSGTVSQFAAPLEELLSLYRRCDQRDAQRISKVLISILLKVQAEEQTLATVFDLLSGQNLYSNEKSTLTMIFEFFQRLRDARRLPALQELGRLAVNKSKTLFEQQQFVSTAILFASSPKDEIASRFHFVLNVPHETLSLSSFKQLLVSCHDVRS